MTVPRLILIVCVLVAVLYAIGVALTRRNSGGAVDKPADTFPAWFSSLGAKFNEVPTADLKLSNGKLDKDRQFVLTAAQPNVTISVAPSSKTHRLLTVRLIDDPTHISKVNFVAGTDGNSAKVFPPDRPKPTDDERTISVPAAGGKLTVQKGASVPKLTVALSPK